MKALSNKAFFNGKNSDASKEFYTIYDNAKFIIELIKKYLFHYNKNRKTPVIMCPWSKEDSAFVKASKEAGFKVINLTDSSKINEYEYDIIVDNPPFDTEQFKLVLSTKQPYFIYWSFLGAYYFLQKGWITSRKIIVAPTKFYNFLTPEGKKKHICACFLTNLVDYEEFVGMGWYDFNKLEE